MAKNKKAKSAKKCVIKFIQNFKDYENCLRSSNIRYATSYLKDLLMLMSQTKASTIFKRNQNYLKVTTTIKKKVINTTYQY